MITYNWVLVWIRNIRLQDLKEHAILIFSIANINATRDIVSYGTSFLNSNENCDISNILLVGGFTGIEYVGSLSNRVLNFAKR